MYVKNLNTVGEIYFVQIIDINIRFEGFKLPSMLLIIN